MIFFIDLSVTRQWRRQSDFKVVLVDMVKLSRTLWHSARVRMVRVGHWKSIETAKSSILKHSERSNSLILVQNLVI